MSSSSSNLQRRKNTKNKIKLNDSKQQKQQQQKQKIDENCETIEQRTATTSNKYNNVAVVGKHFSAAGTLPAIQKRPLTSSPTFSNSPSASSGTQTTKTKANKKSNPSSQSSSLSTGTAAATTNNATSTISSSSSSSSLSSSSSSSSTPPSSSSLCCNGGISVETRIANCCRDTNCRLNDKTAAVPPSQSINDFFKNHDRNRCSVSLVAHNSTTRSTTTNSNRSTTIDNDNRPLLSHHITTNKCNDVKRNSLDRDTSPDSAIDFETERLLAYFNQNHLKNVKTEGFTINFQLDFVTSILFILSFLTRFYKLSSPPNVVFDEIHFGRFVSHYINNIFFFDAHPPLGKQLISSVVALTGFDGNYTYPHIGASYTKNVPIFWMRFVPALCGSLIAPTLYKVLLTAGLRRWTAALAGILVILDNALLTHSRFVLMESMIIFFSTLGVYFFLHCHRNKFPSMEWFLYGIAATLSFTFASSVKYVGFFSFLLAGYLTIRHFWYLLFDPRNSNLQLWIQIFVRFIMFMVIPVIIYLSIFYMHLQVLHKAGPHDSVMTSAFQASLDGGLASITKGQPLKVAHGSQITLRNTHGRTCWLHSHAHVYPVRYPDKRGSSHQQQVTCYSFKDVNNWWIVKKPDREDLVVDSEPDAIKHGDIIQLVHGITSRALNSHDVAAPVTPSCQEVSCYIDYEIKMEAELLWQVDILNRETEGDIWHAIKSEVRLIHKTTNAALRFTGRQLPEWGFNQHEVAADRHKDNAWAIWNVEEHRYTKTQDQRERERQLITAEMIPTKKTKLTFLEKFLELQTKMLWNGNQIQNHMYSSDPFEWPLMDKGIAYWAHNKNGAQIHLLGNILTWYSGTFALLTFILLGTFYLLRRQRLCFDIPEAQWLQFVYIFDIFFIGYLLHFLPYFFMDRTLFLYNYLPALIFKISLLCYVFEHIDFLLRFYFKSIHWIVKLYRVCIILWLLAVLYVFIVFLPLSYGLIDLTKKDLINLRWKDTWDLILLS